MSIGILHQVFSFIKEIYVWGYIIPQILHQMEDGLQYLCYCHQNSGLS